MRAWTQARTRTHMWIHPLSGDKYQFCKLWNKPECGIRGGGMRMCAEGGIRMGYLCECRGGVVSVRVSSDTGVDCEKAQIHIIPANACVVHCTEGGP